ncbi:hypothetical protein AVEN_97127-1 [Araneus ventricosus]|uniref:Uncharacterized protein n=1 Tax=Araneus ventricosus TaxID=182803 RepID=A0A4Y2JUG4_ARAVE|nr:hypothetical protein AVEN_97127-1 [Araneus ventricosus]
MPVQERDAPKLGQVLLRKRMSRGFEFVLILQTTRGSNFGLLATEVYLTSFIILVFSTCVRSIRESLGETTPAGFRTSCPAFLLVNLPRIASFPRRVIVTYDADIPPSF